MISNPSPDRPGLRELLSFYADAGVDEALSEEPIDRFAQAATARPERAQQAPSSDNEASRNPANRSPERELAKAPSRPAAATPATPPRCARRSNAPR